MTPRDLAGQGHMIEKTVGHLDHTAGIPTTETGATAGMEKNIEAHTGTKAEIHHLRHKPQDVYYAAGPTIHGKAVLKEQVSSKG